MLSKPLNLDNDQYKLFMRRLRIEREVVMLKDKRDRLQTTMQMHKQELSQLREIKTDRVKQLGRMIKSYLDIIIPEPGKNLAFDNTRIGYFVGVGIDSLLKSIITKDASLMAEVISSKYLVHLISCLYLCPAKDVPAYYWSLRRQVNLLEEASKRDHPDIKVSECWTMLYSYSARFLNVVRSLYAEEPSFVEQSQWETVCPSVDLQGIIDAYNALPEATPESVHAIFANPKFKILNTDPIIKRIQEEFKVLRDHINRDMDNQFPSRKPDDSIFEVVKVPKTPSKKSKKIEILQEKEEKKKAKLEAKAIKDTEKHKDRVEKIKQAVTINEADDQDVTFFYISATPESNLIFHQNQSNQVCRRTFEASTRYEHSIFPGLTASGTTLNYLCSLMVSGNPDYEGFCDAHRDLGGMKVSKKNGSKLFLFNGPISYHKTLHAPHKSSRFDHVLYRRFYRNCGLHPYFFIIDPEVKYGVSENK